MHGGVPQARCVMSLGIYGGRGHACVGRTIVAIHVPQRMHHNFAALRPQTTFPKNLQSSWPPLSIGAGVFSYFLDGSEL